MNVTQTETLGELRKRVQALQIEVDILNTVKENQEKQVLEGYDQMDQIIIQVEEERNRFQKQRDDLEVAGEFINRVMNTMAETLMVIGPDSRISRCNQRLLDVTGRKETELLGLNPDVLFETDKIHRLIGAHLGGAGEFRSAIYAAFSLKENVEWVAGVMDAAGRPQTHLWRATVLYNSKGKKDGLVIVGTDIRELTRVQNDLMESLKTLNATLGQINALTEKIKKYVPSQLVDKLLGEATEGHFHARKKLTIFFSDIVGFTEATERLDVRTLAKMLNRYLEEMVRIASRHGGTLDKFIGDAVVVFFGDPHSRGLKEDAVACVKMALEMRRRVAELRDELDRAGVPIKLHVRMAVNTGLVTVGDFGSEHRKEYTVVGREVNVASRLQGVAQPDAILVSSATNDLIKDTIPTRLAGEFRLKGIEKAVEAYEVICNQ